MFILKFFNFSKSLKCFFRLLVLLLSLFSFSSLAVYLSLDQGNLRCVENECSVFLNKNQKIKLNDKDTKIFELIEENLDGKEKLISYLFYTTDISNIVAYSGKPLEILISLKLDGVIEDLKLVKHSEPILLTGIPIEKLLEAVCFYKGKNIKNRINIGEDSSGEISVPIIAGATVTSLILHETVLGTSRDVGSILGIIDDIDLEGSLTKEFEKFSWKQLIDIGAIKHYCLDSSFKENYKADKDDLLVDIYFADLCHPSIGRNLLGDSAYFDFINEIETKGSFIIVLNNGKWSFKGSGFVRGGIFDRFRVEQGNNVFTFRDADCKNVYDLDLIDVDDFRETGIFSITNSKYKPWKTWNLALLLNYKTFHVEYKMPGKFCVSPVPAWYKCWKSKLTYIVCYLALWFFVIFIFFIRNSLSKNAFYLSVIYNFVLIIDIYIIGFLFEGQPSVVNIFSLVDNVKNIEAFLFDPSIFLGWVMILLTIFVWGKALFCGWICPFGALQELIFKFRSLLFRNDSSFEFPAKFSDKLRYLRYVVFAVLIFVSFKNFALAERMAEIEPFKTMWNVGIFNRPFWISFYTVSLLAFSLFMYRFFCRFLCPLGAFLSFLSFFTLFRLRRRGTCVACKICEKSCNSRAINKKGFIDSKECFGCFTCLNNMYNPEVCPPIKNEKLRLKYETGKWWI